MHGPLSQAEPDLNVIDRRLVACALIVLAASKIAFSTFAGPLPDEAYYWLWGQRPDLSYFDHPPLQAWLQSATTAVLGHSRLALRAPALLTSLATLALLAWWVRRVRRDGGALTLPLVAAVYFASPVVFIYSTLVFNDHLMIALLGLSAAAFTVVFDLAARERRVHAPALWLAGFAVGLATLSKYNAALFGIAMAATILIVPRLRILLRSPHLYGAGAASLACMAPVFAWNLANDNESFRYNLVDRLSVDWSPATTLEHVVLFAVLAPLTLSPFLVAAAARLPRAKAQGIAASWRMAALAGLLIATATCLALTLLGPVFFYWNLPAYVALLPLAALLMSRGMLRGHLILGMTVAAAFAANYTLLPLSAIPATADDESALSYGWAEVVRAVETQRREHGTEFLVTTDYRTGAILAFETGDRSVDVISARRSQFDLWFDENARKGRDALILSDDRHPLGTLVNQRFATLEHVADVPVTRLGRHLKTYRIHVARGYIPRQPGTMGSAATP